MPQSYTAIPMKFKRVGQKQRKSKGCFVDKNVHVYCLCQQVKPSRHAEQKSENQCVPLPTWRKYARSTSSQVPSNPNSSASTVKVQLSPFSWIHTDQNTFKFLDFITLPLSLFLSLYYLQKGTTAAAPIVLLKKLIRNIIPLFFYYRLLWHVRRITEKEEENSTWFPIV